MKRKLRPQYRTESSDEDSSEDATYNPANEDLSPSTKHSRRTKVPRPSRQTSSDSDDYDDDGHSGLSSDSTSSSSTSSSSSLGSSKDLPIRKLKQKVMQWIRQNYTVGEDGYTAKADIFEAYQAEWRSRVEDGEIELTAPAFGRLVHKAFPGIKSCRMGPRIRARHCYKGLQRLDGISPLTTTTTTTTTSPRQQGTTPVSSPRSSSSSGEGSYSTIRTTTSLSPPLTSPTQHQASPYHHYRHGPPPPPEDAEESNDSRSFKPPQDAADQLSLSTSDQVLIDLEQELHSGLLGLDMSDTFPLKREPFSSEEEDHQDSSEEYRRRMVHPQHIKAEDQPYYGIELGPSSLHNFGQPVPHHYHPHHQHTPLLSAEGETGSPLPYKHEPQHSFTAPSAQHHQSPVFFPGPSLFTVMAPPPQPASAPSFSPYYTTTIPSYASYPSYYLSTSSEPAYASSTYPYPSFPAHPEAMPSLLPLSTTTLRPEGIGYTTGGVRSLLPDL